MGDILHNSLFYSPPDRVQRVGTKTTGLVPGDKSKNYSCLCWNSHSVLSFHLHLENPSPSTSYYIHCCKLCYSNYRKITRHTQYKTKKLWYCFFPNLHINPGNLLVGPTDKLHHSYPADDLCRHACCSNRRKIQNPRNIHGLER